MKDRLAELTAGCEIEAEVSMEQVDLENGLDEEAEADLVKFRKEMDMLSQAVDRIHENVVLIEAQYQNSMDETMGADEKQRAANKISRLLERTEQTSDAIRKRLRRLAKENKDYSSENPEKVGVLRIRVNTHQGLTKRFMAAMQSYEEAQEKHRDHVRGALERQLRKMNPTATDEEIATALRRGETEAVVDNSPLLVELPFEEQERLRNGLADLQSRNNDIRKLEENIIQLHQLFVDMQILVDAQGELLNTIEYNVGETKDKTEAGFQELVQARAHQKSATKKKMCVILLIVVLLVVILTPVLVKYIPVWFPSTQQVVESLPVVGGGAGDNENATANPSNSTRVGTSTARLLSFRTQEEEEEEEEEEGRAMLLISSRSLLRLLRMNLKT